MKLNSSANATSAEASASETPLHTIIVGAGFGGLCMAIKLLAAGFKNILILEKGDEVGGTWRDNQYPGAACDVQSHLYSFSFAPKTDWTQRYAGWAEIQDYILEVTERFGIRPFIRFGQTVCATQFDETSGLWSIRTSAGAHYRCQFWVMASGPLHVPQYPDIKGIESFRGKVMHSARWDKSYDFTGKRVASIGSGGSAIQYVPEIAPSVEKLHVFQRTAAWVFPRDESGYSAWRKRLFARVPGLRIVHRWRLYWSNESFVWILFAPRIALTLQKLLAWHMRRKIDNPALAERLIPDYTIGCKRLLISNKWLPAFNRPNVELVTDGIREIRAHCIVSADGKEREIDCLVLGTGFIVDPRRYLQDFILTGSSGRRLQDVWASAPAANLGITVAGFPNMFLLVGPNSVLGHNSIIFMIEAQVHYVLKCMAETQRRSASSLAVKPEVQQRFNQWVARRLSDTVWNSGCKSWYQTDEGVNFTLWPGSTWRYWLACRRLRAADYEFKFAGHKTQQS